jgi:hypothetical protein
MRSVLLFFFLPVGLYAQDTTCFFADSIKTDSAKVTWKVMHSLSIDSFVVEHYRWQKWVKVGSLKTDPNQDVYCFNMAWHFGENQVRIVFYSSGKTKNSAIAKYVNAKELDGPDMVLWAREDNLRLPAPYNYEIYDKYGNIVKKGYGDSIYIKDLVPDVYYLNYGNRTTEFIRKKKHK